MSSSRSDWHVSQDRGGSFGSKATMTNEVFPPKNCPSCFADVAVFDSSNAWSPALVIVKRLARTFFLQTVFWVRHTPGEHDKKGTRCHPSKNGHNEKNKQCGGHFWSKWGYTRMYIYRLVQVKRRKIIPQPKTTPFFRVRPWNFAHESPYEDLTFFSKDFSEDFSSVKNIWEIWASLGWC